MSSSIFEKEIHPLKQAAGVVAAILISMLVIKGIINPADDLKGNRMYWETSFAMFFCFTLFNSVFGLSFKDQNKYWLFSIISFVIVAIVAIGAATLFSGMSIDEAGTFRWIFLVFTFGYLVFLSIVRAMRAIVQYAQKQDHRLRGE